MPKLTEILCEVCHKPVPNIELDSKYREEMKAKMYSPREEFEKQISMTPQELAAKEALIANLFAEHDAKKEVDESDS